ncbi:MAG: bifunctional DNA-binding transcriptional regulator/O6-methylguanine-DNA methyltransferase Ada [Proteobacteria bacterium]|nr:bifunctional DNA-binding transcriptional regulator/O6-methylguanine-DNA methyltransferase Ada [Pseudomonadota bacterium]
MPVDQDTRWAALNARDPAADGTFLYSVATTGVYCRPSCAARRPNPRNVAFHAHRAAAEAAGFRPCLRCRPDLPPFAERQAARVAAACRFIETSDTAPTLGALAEAMGVSPHHLQRTFKGVTGISPRDYAAAHRAGRLRQALGESGAVTEAIFAAGYGSTSRFYERSAVELGMTASAFRAGAPGCTIRFAVGQSTLGAVLVARSARGLCAILMDDDPEVLVRDLQDRFPRAELIGADAAFEAEVAQVIGLVEAPGLGLGLPLDIRGTAFQQRVWRALQDIPPGRTASYARIATSIGAPRSVRAVAGACAANPLAVAVPCHRVVRTDGGLSGYRWGVERKRALLHREAAEG